MKEEDKIQLIEDYITGQLSVQAKDDLQQQLQQDPFLAQEVDLYKNIITGLALGGRKDMKAHLQALDKKAFAQDIQAPSADLQAEPAETATAENAQEHGSPSGNPAVAIPEGKIIQPFWRRNAWLAGIAACLVLGLLTFLWINNANSTDNLFATYYSPYPNVVAAIERGETIQDATKQAMQAYENGDYARAMQDLHLVLNNNPNENALYLYLGICYIETGRLDSAQVYLEKAAADTSGKLYTQAKWYLALTHLKNKEEAEAKTQLQSLSQENGVYAEKARQLLDEL